MQAPSLSEPHSPVSCFQALLPLQRSLLDPTERRPLQFYCKPISSLHLPKFLMLIYWGDCLGVSLPEDHRSLRTWTARPVHQQLPARPLARSTFSADPGRNDKTPANSSQGSAESLTNLSYTCYTNLKKQEAGVTKLLSNVIFKEQYL